ncbi:MAG: toll/interleukin-1 receptor domain-containing protein [Lachnospiraceae bacterium]|nr:toll/interleukin-1 receptor domain-containing protein [Lachnospiraceae bacterium]
MGIESLNCQCCGAPLKIVSSTCECEYCGNINIIGGDAGKYINQLNRANKLRQQCEFDSAYSMYDAILSENTPSADILWSQALCEYGIEYVPDPVSSRYFPTLHRIKDINFLNSRCFTEALELADDEQKKQLNSAAEEIARIQEEYLNIASNEDPYDVFICYKETDTETGEMTEDVSLAEELYNELTGYGLKVFFARETLKEKLSIDYEPYIFAALKSAKAMAVIGTKAEYFTSVWVKNEWGRFLKLMEKNPEKMMFFACDNPEELPRAFASKQAQLLGNDRAIKNLAANIVKYLSGTLTKKSENRKPLLDQEEYDRIIAEKAKNYANSLYRTKYSEKERKLMQDLSDLSKTAMVTKKIYEKSFHIGSVLLLSFSFIHIFYAVSIIRHYNDDAYIWNHGIFGIVLTILLYGGLFVLFSSMVFLNYVTLNKADPEAENFMMLFRAGTFLLSVASLSYIVNYIFFPVSDTLTMFAVPILIFLFGFVRRKNRTFAENMRSFEKAESIKKSFRDLEDIAKQEFLEYDAKQLEELNPDFDVKAEIKDYHFDDVKPAVDEQIKKDIDFLYKMNDFMLDTPDLTKNRNMFTIIYGSTAILFSTISMVIILASRAFSIFADTFDINLCL